MIVNLVPIQLKKPASGAYNTPGSAKAGQPQSIATEVNVCAPSGGTPALLSR